MKLRPPTWTSSTMASHHKTGELSGGNHQQAVLSLPDEVRDRLENVQDNIRILQKQIKDRTPTKPLLHLSSDTLKDVADVFKKLAHCAQIVSDGCTKLAVLFSKPPIPLVQECGVMCERVEQSTLQLVSTFYQLSLTQGKTLQSEVERAVLGILNSLDKLVTGIMQHGCTGSAVKLRGTGSVWEYCDAMAKISKDNRSAALKVLLSELHLLRDAWSEVQELKANNGRSEDGFEGDMMEELNAALQTTELDDSSTGGNGGGTTQNGDEWNEDELKFVNPALKLIEVSTEISKESSTLLIMYGDASEEALIEEMDMTVDLLKLLSPKVDDLASELPAPLDCEHCHKLGVELSKVLLKAVDNLSNFHFCAKAASKWKADKYRQTIRTAIDSFPSNLQ